MKEQYLHTITNLLQKCDDLEMLEIILQLLQKCGNHAIHAADLA